MADQNPYTSPGAALDSGGGELYEPSIFSFHGRLGRLRYLAYCFGVMLLLMLVIMPIMGGTAFMAGDGEMGIVAIILIAVSYLAAIVMSVMFVKRRLNDLNRSGWWFLLSFVPLVNLLLTIYLLFFPGSEGPNNYGPPPVANTLGVKILGWILPLLFVIGIVAAIAVPAYQGYLMRAQ